MSWRRFACAADATASPCGANSFGALGGSVFPHTPALASAAIANERARTLRKTMSDAERKLWHALRAKRLDGARFGGSPASCAGSIVPRAPALENLVGAHCSGLQTRSVFDQLDYLIGAFIK